MYVRNIDKFILDGKIIIQNKNLSFTDRKEWEKLKILANTLIKDRKEEN